MDLGKRIESNTSEWGISHISTFMAQKFLKHVFSKLSAWKNLEKSFFREKRVFHNYLQHYLQRGSPNGHRHFWQHNNLARPLKVDHLPCCHYQAHWWSLSLAAESPGCRLLVTQWFIVEACTIYVQGWHLVPDWGSGELEPHLLSSTYGFQSPTAVIALAQTHNTPGHNLARKQPTGQPAPNVHKLVAGSVWTPDRVGTI